MTTTLMILDGFGFNPETSGNAIAAAATPNLDMLMEKYPHTLLGASGLSVGLPHGQMGNSEVGAYTHNKRNSRRNIQQKHSPQRSHGPCTCSSG